jgi:hypothetical protein
MEPTADAAALVLDAWDVMVFAPVAFPMAESMEVVDSSKEEALSFTSTLLPTALPATLPREALAPRSSEDSLRRRCRCCCSDNSEAEEEESGAAPEREGGRFERVSEAMSEESY